MSIYQVKASPPWLRPAMTVVTARRDAGHITSSAAGSARSVQHQHESGNSRLEWCPWPFSWIFRTGNHVRPRTRRR